MREEAEHLLLLTLVVIERVPGVFVELLKPFGGHLFGVEDDLPGVVVIPIEVEDAPLAEVVVVALGVGEGRHDGELGQVEVDLEEEVDEALDVVFRLVVEAQQDGALDADAVVVVTLDALADVVRGVVDGLIDVPGAGLCGQVEHLRIVLDGVADPLLFEGDHLAKEIHLPLLVLGQ